jgi:hypothetical protein
MKKVILIAFLVLPGVLMATEPKVKEVQKNDEKFELESPAQAPKFYLIKVRATDVHIVASATYVGQTEILIPVHKGFSEDELYVEFSN